MRGQYAPNACPRKSWGGGLVGGDGGFDFDEELEAVANQRAFLIQDFNLQHATGDGLDLLCRQVVVFGLRITLDIGPGLFQSCLLGFLEHHGFRERRRFAVAHRVGGLGS
jgi:hypothetical protein